MVHTVGAGGGADPVLRGGARLLVVDDDEMALRSLERALRDEGFNVHTARSVGEAKELIGAQEFDAGLIDLLLDEAPGAELVTELRTAPKPCCAAMITGATRTEAARQAFAAGAEELLAKPVAVEELVQAVRRTLDRTRHWREQVDANAPKLPAEEDAHAQAAIAPGSRPTLVPASYEPLPTLRALDIEKTADELARLGHLTDRERAILVRLLRGEQNTEIAETSGASPRTVKFHVSNILKKLRISQRAELLRFLF